MNSVCPNCGASLTNKGFVRTCDFCGAVFNSDDTEDNVSQTPVLTNNKAATKDHYKYLAENEKTVSQKKPLLFVKKGKIICLQVPISTPIMVWMS